VCKVLTLMFLLLLMYWRIAVVVWRLLGTKLTGLDWKIKRLEGEREIFSA